MGLVDLEEDLGEGEVRTSGLNRVQERILHVQTAGTEIDT